MREVVFKNLTSLSSRKKDIVLTEAFERNGVLAKTERRCFYFIRNISSIEGCNNIDKWIDAQNGGKKNARRFHIFKEHNDALNEDKVICRIEGEFYAVISEAVYTIGFLHYFKVCFTKTSMAK